jgi:XTP/dITP diphosphohydrolase
MAPIAELVVATSNLGKLREFQDMLQGFAARLIAQTEAGIVAVEETAGTFVGNALLKARHASRLTGLPALADDSGLEVDALGGRPGVYSARYAKIGATDVENNAKLLAELQGFPGPHTARYHCAIVLVRNAEDSAPVLALGSWEGRITSMPRGTGGFGYDPLFLVGNGSLTAAELETGIKNRISHRAIALSRLKTLVHGA